MFKFKPKKKLSFLFAMVSICFFVLFFIPFFASNNSFLFPFLISSPNHHQASNPPPSPHSPPLPTYVFGIYTVKRPIAGIDYLVETVGNLISSFECRNGENRDSFAAGLRKPPEKTHFCIKNWEQRAKIVIYNSEKNWQNHNESISTVKRLFSPYLQKGSIILVDRSDPKLFQKPDYFPPNFPSPPPILTPSQQRQVELLAQNHSNPHEWWYQQPFSKPVQRTFGDALSRVLWRAKMVLDNSFMLHFIYSNIRFSSNPTQAPDYIISLEDDIKITNHTNLIGALDTIVACSDCPLANHTTWFACSLAAKVRRYKGPSEVRERLFSIGKQRRYFGGAYGFLYRVNPRPETMGEFIRHLYGEWDQAPLDWLIGPFVMDHEPMLTHFYLMYGLVLHRGHISSLSGQRRN
eukprot:Sdes_comp19523_c0_seq1m11101